MRERPGEAPLSTCLLSAAMPVLFVRKDSALLDSTRKPIDALLIQQGAHRLRSAWPDARPFPIAVLTAETVMLLNASLKW